MRQLDYGHPPTLLDRIEARLRWPIVLLPLLLCAGLLILSWRNAHGLESFQLQIRRFHMQLLSERDQLCFSIEDEFSPIGVKSFGGVPKGVLVLPIWSHHYFDEAGAPERDDYSTYEITMHYHPFMEWGWGLHRRRGLKEFRISRPFGPANAWQTFGWAIILPSWWLAVPMLLPMMLWSIVQFVSLARRGRGEQSILT